MKTYEFEFLKNGKKHKKTINAKNLSQAQQKAYELGFELVSIKEKNKNYKALSDENFVLFFKDLALLIEVGFSVANAINELRNVYKYKILSKLYENLVLAQSLSKAFESSNFGLSYAELALVRMAENTGNMSEVFRQIVSIRQKSQEAQKNLKKSLRYPCFVVLSVIGAFLFLMLFVVPNFKNLFESLGSNLPFLTILMLKIYDFLIDFGSFFALIFAFLFLMLIFLYKKSKNFALFFDFLSLKIPPFSGLILYNQNYYFFIIFSLLLKSGIPTLKAFDLAKQSLKNKFLILKYEKLESLINASLELSTAFKKIGIFSPLVFSMLNVAMKSGKLDILSEEIARYYKQKNEELLEKFLSLVEPLLTLFVALLVLFLALGLFLPMWELSSVSSFK